ncbi:MAG TPA: hypothetical protein PKY59_16795 [Pyrinomonadaceae bacterium]|nr:hypothetical protein [Pyrinomonadaceae bacterium]
MKLKVFLTIALLVFPVFANPQKARYIGYKHKGVIVDAKLPNGVKHLGGGLTSKDNYGVSRYEKNGKLMLWLEKITSRDADGVPSWIVKDVLTLGKLKKNEMLLFSYGSSCKQNEKVNIDLIVKVLVMPKKELKVLQAWKANPKKEKFENALTKGVKCEFIEP